MSDHNLSIRSAPAVTGWQPEDFSFELALERASSHENEAVAPPAQDPPAERNGLLRFLGFGRKARASNVDAANLEASPQAWPPKDSKPYTGVPIYFPNSDDMVPYEHLAEMPDGRLYYRSNGRETLGALVTMAAPLNAGGMRNRTQLVGLNQLPIVLDDKSVPFKDGAQVLLRPARPNLPPPAKAPERPIVQIKESPVDHDRYYGEQIEKQVVATAMGTVKAEANVWNPSPQAKAAESILEERFGKPYVETMKQSWAAEQQAAMLQRQGTIDLPPEEKQARARAQFMQKLDEDFGAFSPVMKFFLPTYAMPDMGFAPSPIEIVTDIGAGVHFSTGGRGLHSYRRGSQELTRVNSNDGHSYFVTESSHLRTVKPAKPEQFTEVRTTGGQTVWVSPAAPKVSTKTADKMTAWVDPPIQGSRTKSPAASGEKIPSSQPTQKPANGSVPVKVKREPAAGKAPADTNTSSTGTAGQGVNASPKPAEQPKPAVMTADGTVKTVEPAKSGQAAGNAGAGKPPVDGSGKVTLDNALHPGDPARKGIETLKTLIEAPTEDGRLLSIFEKKSDGEGINRSMVNPDKVIFSANGELPKDKLKQAFGENAKIETRTSAGAIVYEVTVPYVNARTGAKGGPARLVDPKIELSDMTQDVNWSTMDQISTPRGRVRDRTHADDPLMKQQPINGVDGWTYHSQFAEARTVAAKDLEAANNKGAAYYSSPQDFMFTLDNMHRAQMGANKPLYTGVNPGQLRRADRLFFGPAPLSHMADLETIAKRYGESYRLNGPSVFKSENVFASKDAPKLKMTPAMTEATWAKHNPTLPYDAKLVNPWHMDGQGYQYAGTKTVKSGHPDYARQLQYEKAVVETYQKVAWEKGKEAMDLMKQRNDVNPAENTQRFQQLDNEFMAKLGEHTYYLMNARKYDNGNASIYMNEVNMLLRMGGYNEVPHGLLDHAAYRFSPENFSRHFTDWVRENN